MYNILLYTDCEYMLYVTIIHIKYDFYVKEITSYT